MATVPQFALGRNVGSGLLTAQTAGTSGILTSVTATSVSFTGLWRSVKINFTKKTEEISASDVVQENEVPISRGTSLDVEFLVDNYTVSSRDLAAAAFGSYDYWLYTIKAGDGGHTYTGYGLLSDFSIQTNNKSELMVTAALKPCGIDMTLS